MVGIRDVRNNLSNHFALQYRLLQRPMGCHISYLRVRRAFTLYLPTREELRLAKNKSQEMKSPKLPPPPLNRPPRPKRMSETSTQLIDEHTILRQNLRHNRNVVCTLTKPVRRSLLVEFRRRAEKAVEDIVA